jgi:hypothetical protein
LAVYRSASTSERRAAHRRLAEVIQDLEERAPPPARSPRAGRTETWPSSWTGPPDALSTGELRGRRPSWPTWLDTPRPHRPRSAVAARDAGGRVPLRGGRRGRSAGARP